MRETSPYDQERAQASSIPIFLQGQVLKFGFEAKLIIQDHFWEKQVEMNFNQDREPIFVWRVLF